MKPEMWLATELGKHTFDPKEAEQWRAEGVDVKHFPSLPPNLARTTATGKRRGRPPTTMQVRQHTMESGMTSKQVAIPTPPGRRPKLGPLNVLEITLEEAPEPPPARQQDDVVAAKMRDMKEGWALTISVPDDEKERAVHRVHTVAKRFEYKVVVRIIENGIKVWRMAKQAKSSEG